jgi:hypothetical protein
MMSSLGFTANTREDHFSPLGSSPPRRPSERGRQVDEAGNLYAVGADMSSPRTDNLRLSTLIEGLPKVSVIIVVHPLLLLLIIIVLKGEPEYTPFAFSLVHLGDDVTKLAAV